MLGFIPSLKANNLISQIQLFFLLYALPSLFPFPFLKPFIDVFVLILFFLTLLHECNFRIEVAVQLRTSAIISTGVWLKMSNTCLYGVQVQGTTLSIVALVMFFMTRMWSRLLRKRYRKLFVLANLTGNFLEPMT